MFKHNPEEFISKTITLIKEQKATMIVDHISYNVIDGQYDSSIFTADKNIDFIKAYEAKKNVQDYVILDSEIERSLAEKTDEDKK
jgi:type III restriction enzyme